MNSISVMNISESLLPNENRTPTGYIFIERFIEEITDLVNNSIDMTRSHFEPHTKGFTFHMRNKIEEMDRSREHN
ncbi:hypothetical protein VIBNISFn118_600009 [Vibrio nigripulchritudo SFn118]|nr:hypothetical protein VIBNISFn118_600009 [Vibrio nigripulchritudo SFn118]